MEVRSCNPNVYIIWNHIVAIILLKPGSDGFKAKNIIQTLNRSSGNIELKVKKNAEYKLDLRDRDLQYPLEHSRPEKRQGKVSANSNQAMPTDMWK